MPRYLSRFQYPSAALLLTCIILGIGSPAAAQQPSKADSAQRAMEQASAMMGPMMGQMMEAMIDGMLKVMSRPESAERLATFTRNYYDALIRKGFTKEEALRIVIATGLPQMPTGPN